MNDVLPTPGGLAIPAEVQQFAVEKGIARYVNAIVKLARQAFPASAVYMSVEQDAEDETHQYIALDVDASGMGIDELLAGQRIWSAGIAGVCPSRHAVYFVLGWR